ncbi:MAG: hypothetical protein CSB32_01010 [Desulfobacterales bacterium]|nr:MAG: hypothetical protein CSB32_01010 [Desulfobacterales bacterium]
MTEIKSTMEIVLERASRMAASAADNSMRDTLLERGMRLAAEFIDSGQTDLNETLAGQRQEERLQIREGMLQILLRNILLPRDEDLQQTGQTAIRGLLVLGEGREKVLAIGQELSQILGQYQQHKEQTIEQLQQVFASRLQQQPADQGKAGQETLDFLRHPKYREELGRLLTDLNSQYNEALEQRKEALRLCF